MKFTKLLLILSLFISISACTSNLFVGPTDTPQPTNTPEPTLIPTPLSPFTGKLFFDMNGSGLQDEASFIYDANRLIDSRQLLQTDLVNAINDLVNSHSELKDGDLTTILEPGLSGYQVCIEKECTTTSWDGSFEIPNKTGSETALLKIIDPNKDVPALAMRYINGWKGPILIPAYEANGGQVPEQHLNDTVIIPIEKGVTIKQNDENKIGFMQGFLTLPLPFESWGKVTRILGYDHDPDQNKTVSYDGNYERRTPFSSCRFGTDDGHIGIDYGLSNLSVEIASLPGDLETWINTSRNGSWNLRIKSYLNIGGGNNFETVYSHMSSFLVNPGQIYRGQILALSGSTGTEWEHLHIDAHYGMDLPNREDAYLGGPRREKDIFGVLEPIPVSFDYERFGLWSVFNLSIFS